MTAEAGTHAPPRIGFSVTAAFQQGSSADVRDVLRAADEAAVDYLQIGDHVSFIDGTGFDGLVYAAAALCAQDRMPVTVGLYLLALRHPVLVGRQLADIARIAPGRITLGVGVGGEDRHEFESCGVDPSTRGRRTDEALDVLRALMAGDPVTAHGEFFDLDDALISPAPRQEIPFLIGGRSDAALRRTALRGDGWLGLWVSPERYGAAVRVIATTAAEAGREVGQWDHGLNLWCGLDTERGDGRSRLAAAMERRYKLPYERFERWCPTGSADDIADYISRYVEVGCRHVTLVLPGTSLLSSVRGVAAIRDRVRSRFPSSPAPLVRPGTSSS